MQARKWEIMCKKYNGRKSERGGNKKEKVTQESGEERRSKAEKQRAKQRNTERERDPLSSCSLATVSLHKRDVHE